MIFDLAKELVDRELLHYDSKALVIALYKAYFKLFNWVIQAAEEEETAVFFGDQRVSYQFVGLLPKKLWYVLTANVAILIEKKDVFFISLHHNFRITCDIG